MNIKILAFIPIAGCIASCQTLGLSKYLENEKGIINNYHFKDYKWQCDNGDLVACALLGQKLTEIHYGTKTKYGKDTFQYPYTAKKYLEKTCNIGYQTNDANLATSCGFLADVELQLTEDLNEYKRRYHQGCDAGVGASCRILGRIYELGPDFDSSLSADYQKAGELYDRCCQIRGNFEDDLRDIACSKASFLSLQGKYSKKYSSVEYSEGLERACALEDAKSCYEAGLIYEKGIQTHNFKLDPSIDKAYDYFSYGCSLKLLDSCKAALRIADLYKTGSVEYNVDKDIQKAYKKVKNVCIQDTTMEHLLKECKDL